MGQARASQVCMFRLQHCETQFNNFQSVLVGFSARTKSWNRSIPGSIGTSLSRFRWTCGHGPRKNAKSIPNCHWTVEGHFWLRQETLRSEDSRSSVQTEFICLVLLPEASCWTWQKVPEAHWWTISYYQDSKRRELCHSKESRKSTADLPCRSTTQVWWWTAKSVAEIRCWTSKKRINTGECNSIRNQTSQIVAMDSEIQDSTARNTELIIDEERPNSESHQTKKKSIRRVKSVGFRPRSKVEIRNDEDQRSVCQINCLRKVAVGAIVKNGICRQNAAESAITWQE